MRSLRAVLAGICLLCFANSAFVFEPEYGSGERLEMRNQVEQSRQTWLKLRPKLERYHYRVIENKNSVDQLSTTITVDVSGSLEIAIIRRVVGVHNGQDVAFVEGPGTIDSHSVGAPARTLSKLYDYCLNNILSKNGRYVSWSVDFFANGLLKSCFYINGVGDVTVTGLFVDSIDLVERR